MRYGDHVFHKGKIPWKFPLKSMSITGYQHYKEHERTGTDRVTDGDLKLTLNTLRGSSSRITCLVFPATDTPCSTL